MRKETIRLTEANLRGIISETVSRILREYKREGDLDHRNPYNDDEFMKRIKDNYPDKYDQYMDKAYFDYEQDSIDGYTLPVLNPHLPTNKKEENEYSWAMFNNDKIEKNGHMQTKKYRDDDYERDKEWKNDIVKYAYKKGYDNETLNKLNNICFNSWSRDVSSPEIIELYKKLELEVFLQKFKNRFQRK